MELKWLEDFLTLARTGNFSRAAQERNVTQSAFSRRIQALESWLGVALVDRSSYPTTLTRAGEAAALYPFCLEAGRGASREAAIACLAAMPAWNAVDRIGALEMPTLVLYGDRDRSYNLDDAVGLARGIPDARLCILPDCAHNVHLEKSDFFNQVVADFLLKTD